MNNLSDTKLPTSSELVTETKTVETKPDLDSYTDQEIALLVPRDKNAFAVLIKRYEHALTRYMKRIGLTSDEDCADVLQNVFIKAYRNIHSFDTKLSFSAWIYRIAHNETISFFRSKKARPEGNMIDDPEEFLGRVYDDTADVSEEVDRSINAEHVNRAIQSLDEKYRTILVLRYFEERDYGAISDILQIPPGSVATLIHRAKKQLAQKLEHIK